MASRPLFHLARNCLQAFLHKEIFVLSTAIWCEIVIILLEILCIDIMASFGQKKGGCGHIMASFDTHIRCARCRSKGSGSDPCVQGKDDCAACLLRTPEQRKQLATPTYKLHKEKKSSVKQDVLIDPSQVNVVGPVDLNQSTASAASVNVSLDDSCFKKELSDLKDEWSTRFARIEALLTMGSNPISAQPISAVGHIAPVHPVWLRDRDRNQLWMLQWILSNQKLSVSSLILTNRNPLLTQDLEPTFGPPDREPVVYDDIQEDQASGSEADLQEKTEFYLKIRVTGKQFEVSGPIWSGPSSQTGSIWLSQGRTILGPAPGVNRLEKSLLPFPQRTGFVVNLNK